MRIPLTFLCRFVVIGIFLASGSGTASRAEPSPAAPADTSAWLKDYQSAKVVAQQAGKPLIVVIRCER